MDTINEDIAQLNLGETTPTAQNMDPPTENNNENDGEAKPDSEEA